jgi:PAS domain S-box-containing protein
MGSASRVALKIGLPLLAGALSCGFALLASAIAGQGQALTASWIGNATIVAFLLARPRREWAPLLAAGWAGAALAGLTAGDALPLALALATCALVEIAAVATLFRRRVVGATALLNLEQLRALALAAITGPAVALPLTSLSLALLGAAAPPVELLRGFAVHALGIAVLVPLLLAILHPDRSGEGGRSTEFVLLLTLTLASAVWLFTRQTSSIFLLTPMLVLAGLRLRPDRAALLAALACLVAVLMTTAGLGPLSTLDPQLRGFLLQAFIATAVILTLPIAALKQDQARTAAALRLREEHYRLLADNSSDLVLRLSANGEADYVSSAAGRMLGLPARTLRGSALAGRIHPEDRSRFTTALDRVRRTGEAVTCFRMRHARGSDRWIEAHMRLVGPAFSLLAPGDHHSCAAAAEGRCQPGSDAPCASFESPAATGAAAPDWPIVASLRDIHDRRSAELHAAQSATRLRESNRLLMMAEELASLGHWVLDSARNELVLSAQAATVLGLAQLTLDVRDALAMLRPDDRLRLLRILAAARRAQVPFECIVRLDEAEGGRTLQLRMQLQGEGHVSSLFGVVSDITAKLETEQRLMMAVEEARSAASFRSQFLATMSHEIRTPMTGVIGMIELLEADPTLEERRLYLQTLRQSGDLLMAVLNDILDFSKVDAGRITIADEPFDLGATLLTILRLFDRTASARGLELKLEGPAPGSIWLRGDAVRLRQVLSNLLSNAIKFSERGEVVLRCAVQPARGGRHRLRLSVIDQGIGIAPALRARLFEPFVQGNEGEAVGGAAGGTGLGLAISRRLVAAMGGTILVQSRPARGTTFTIDLTLDDAAPQVLLDATASSAPVPPLDILLAEDNPVNQLLVTALCKRLGHRVTCAADGIAAIEAAAARHFDLILMDMQMPRCDGLTATRRIRSGPGPCAGVPIVALTADASSSQRPLYEEAGLDGLLTKPIDSAAFARTLAQLATVGQRRRHSLLAPQPPAPQATSPLGSTTLDELRAMLGAARLDQLLDLLAAELDQRPLAIRSALADRDFPAASAQAHSLKGAAANLGALPVSEAARELEDRIAAAARGDPRLLAAALRHLAAEVSLAQQAITLLRHTNVADAIHA